MNSLAKALQSSYWHAMTQLRLLRNLHLPAWKRYLAIRLAVILDKRHIGAGTRNLILLAWEFPPLVSGGVYRPASLARYASESSWRIEVLAGPPPEQPSHAGLLLSEGLPESIIVRRTQAIGNGPRPWGLPDIDGGILNAILLFNMAKDSLKGNTPGVILASGPPFHNFVAGMWLAKYSGWKLVLDYRDEWTETPFRFVQKDGPNRQWEIRCLERADLVIHTTPSQVAHARSRFPVLADTRQAVVYNGWEPGDFAEVPATPPRDAATPITLAYLGNLGAMAAPDAFLDTLSAALMAHPELRARIKVLLVGHKRPDALEALRAFPFPEVIELVDSIPKPEACSMMQKVDGLLLLNPVGLHRYIQGKLYEYIASGTPILVFGRGGEMGKIVDSLGAGMTVAEGDAVGLATALQGLRAQRHGNPEQRSKWLASRERAVLAGALYRQLDTLIDTPQKSL